MATGWTVQGSNPSGGEIFRLFRQALGPHQAFYTIGKGAFLGVKRPGHGDDHPPPSSAEVKERLEL